ncbi:DNA mismatch repair protein MutS [Saccharibacillus sp. CPCC 101409]|nr:DNA mismatch repair protein MutS [Saccharibacillus sp. CPCC 101409]MDO3408483.1 DNA mismatch repair protein MutS [Saccharibacillus sp. CPCC 101409]
MNDNALERLEYGRIKRELSAYAVSYLGRRHIEELAPLSDARILRRKLDETDEAAGVLRRGASIPLPSLAGMDTFFSLLGSGYVFTEQDFMHLHQFLRSCNQLIDYMRAKAEWAPHAAAYASGMHRLERLREEIERCVRHGRVPDSASRELSKVRRRMATIEERSSRRMAELMAKHRPILQESLAVQRGGRSALPVRKEHRKLVKGAVLDESSSGQTVYIEPEEIRQFHDELERLRAEEGREEMKILSELTGLAEQFGQELNVNAELVGEYDFLFAKARYALALDAVNVKLNERGLISLRGARHPLLGPKMVPLDFELGGRYRMLIVTGPNTGGKTLSLKTVGLLTLMAQSGLLIPAEEGSELSVFGQIQADIGDGQSIEQALSTFSAHIRRVKDILETADRRSLILIDEMASGTDPGEGVGLSIAILEELRRRGACVVVTTHFTEIKNFASATPDCENARMEFDAETLRPLYRLTIGEAGRSYAFAIAKKLGLPDYVTRRAEELTRRPERNAAEDPPASAFGTANAPADQAEDASLLPEASLCKAKEPNAEARPPQQEAGSEEAATPPAVYRIGDSVAVPYLGQTGIVYSEEDGMGTIGVQIQGKKIRLARKRLKPHIARESLYPEDYDLSIVFDSKENRKKRRQMERKHVEGVTIELPPDEDARPKR